MASEDCELVLALVTGWLEDAVEKKPPKRVLANALLFGRSHNHQALVTILLW